MSRPYVPVLYYSRSGGTPYGASHASGTAGTALGEVERDLAHALGVRLANVARRLTSTAS